MNMTHSTYQPQYTKLLRRCRHPRVPVKSPSSTCCRPTTFFWCGSRVDAIELLLFRGQNSIKKQSSTTLAARTALASSAVLTAVPTTILCYTNTKLATSRKWLLFTLPTIYIATAAALQCRYLWCAVYIQHVICMSYIPSIMYFTYIY